MLRSQRLRTALIVLAGLPSCTRGAADTAERVARFEAKLSAELGTEVKLECPAMVDNQYHYCTAMVVDQEDLAFPVRVNSRGNDLEYTTKLWVSGTRMTELGTHALEEKLDLVVDSLTCPEISHLPEGATVRCEASSEGITIPVEVSCPQPVVVSVPGKRFECTATMPDETTDAVHYLITSTEGLFEFGTEPPQKTTNAVAPAEAPADPETDDRGEAPT